MTITDYINQEIVKLWNHEFKENDDVYMPLTYREIKQADLLFISLNPSFNANNFQLCLKETNYSDINLEKFFHWRNRADFDLNKAK
jgi:hypothetical protein